MPKVVDHEQRRAELAAALWRVVGRAGTAGATVRAVAAEAGWSTGALRHYFASQDELLGFAVELLMERVPARIVAHLADEDLSPRERARRLLMELVPADETTRVEAMVYLALLETTRTTPALDHARGAAWVGSRHLCRLVVAEMREVPGPSNVGDHLATDELEVLAADLHTWADGITLQGARWPDRLTPAEMREAAERQLARLES